MPHILLVEDDPILGDAIRLHLELEGYEVTRVHNLAEANSANQNEKFDLVLLDLGLPDGNGLTFCHRLRDNGSRVPIIILSAQTEDDTVVSGLNAGANDYVRKPFSNRELIARIKRALREPVLRQDQIRYGSLLLLLEQRKVTVDGREIEFLRREFDLLLAFVSRAESVLTRQNIIDAIKPDGDISDRTIDSHVSHIRKRLKEAQVEDIKIKSEYGIGYRLIKEKS